MTRNRPRIVCDSAIVGAAELLSHFCDLVQIPGAAIDSQTLAGADGLIVRTVTRVGEELLRGTSVKAVATAPAGTDHLDLSWLASQGITFGDAAGANAQAVAQFVATIVVQRWASLASAVVVGYLALATGVALLQPGGPDPFGVIALLLLAGVLVVSWYVLGRLWRRSYQARPVTLSTDPTPGEIYGMPELDEAPKPHRGLSGEEIPPTRW